MKRTKKGNLWQRWEKEVEKFKRELSAKDSPPPVVIRHWRRHLLFIFMQELSKNILDEQETFDSIIDRIIVAIQVGCGFECVRFYRVTDKIIYLDRISEGHDPVDKKKLRLPIGVKDDAAETLFTGEPLLLEDADKSNLKFREYLNLKGPYAAIPLFVEGKPLGVISANISHSGKPEENILWSPEYFDQVDTFARHIMASIGNRKIFEQRNQKIKQLKLIDKFAKLIQSETLKINY